MRKRNLKIQVAALAVTGAIATTPFVAKAEEASSTATSTEAAAPLAGTTEAAAPATSTEATASGTEAASATPATSTATPAAGTATEPVTVVEPAVDSSTTVENNVKDVVTVFKENSVHCESEK